MTMGRALMFGMVLAAFYYFLFFDSGIAQRANIAAAAQQATELENQIKMNQAKLDRAAVYKKTVAEVGSTITKLLGVIPEHFGIPDLMKLVSNEVKVAGSSLSNITPGDPQISHVAKEFEELTVTVDTSGSFLQHMVFLSNLTKIPQILIVRKFDMTMTREAKGDESPTVHMVAEIVAYRYRGIVASSVTPKPGGHK
jgi:Tfp pilus assembly protein PilO